MTDRAESILAAVTTLVTDLLTTGSNVVRDRAWPSDVDAGLSVEMGSENPVGSGGFSFQDEELEIIIAVQVKAPQGQLSAVLNKIRAEIYAALLADYKLGLEYVHRIRWNGRSRPQNDHLEKAITEQELSFIVHYRHSYTSTES